MAVETTATSASFIGTGVSSTYAPGFYVNSSDQVKVYLDGVLKTLGDDYVVNNVGSASGCSIVATFTLGATVYIERVTPITQLVDTQNNETILEDVLDAAFDKLTMISQELDGKVARAPLMPKGETGYQFPAAASRVNKVFGFDAAGAATLLTLTGSVINDSAAVGFIAPGTGAVTRSVQNKLRELPPHPNDYSSFTTYLSSLVRPLFVQNGGRIMRESRLFLGGAQDCDGIFPSTNRDWLSIFQTTNGFPEGTILSAQFAAINQGTNADTASAGAVFGIQTRYFDNPSAWALGCTSIVVANNTTISNAIQAYYGEAHRVNGTGSAYGIEVNTRTLTDTIQATPWAFGDVVCYQAANGAEFGSGAAFDASAAYQIAANPRRFKTGISIRYDSLTNGLAIALAAMGTNPHRIQWINSGGNQAGSITSTNTLANAHNLLFTDSGFQINSADGFANFRVAPIASANNFIAVNAAAGTSTPSLGASSFVNPDVDLLLTPQGAGHVQFGTFASTSDVPVVGSVSIKDTGGTVRKLAIIA